VREKCVMGGAACKLQGVTDEWKMMWDLDPLLGPSLLPNPIPHQTPKPTHTHTPLGSFGRLPGPLLTACRSKLTSSRRSASASSTPSDSRCSTSPPSSRTSTLSPSALALDLSAPFRHCTLPPCRSASCRLLWRASNAYAPRRTGTPAPLTQRWRKALASSLAVVALPSAFLRMFLRNHAVESWRRGLRGSGDSTGWMGGRVDGWVDGWVWFEWKQ